jgi:threonine dehydrogenase-like Zn-dependent dehydrogenase
VYEDVAEFVGGSVSYPRVGSITLHGGADVVYETSGTAHFVEKGLRFAGEGKRFVLSSLKQTQALDIGPIWHKAVKILGPGWSNSVFFDGDKVNAFDAAATLMERHSFPVDDLVSHRFPLDQYQQAFATLEDRAAQRAVKVIFHHVV